MIALLLAMALHPCKEDSLRQVLARYHRHHVSQRVQGKVRPHGVVAHDKAPWRARCDTVYVIREILCMPRSSMVWRGHESCSRGSEPDRVTAQRCPPVSPPTEEMGPACGGAFDQLLQDFEVTAGFRWETATEPERMGTTARCNLPPPPHHHEVKDPFYLGVALHLPLTERLSINGEFDRDWTEAAEWQTRTWLGWQPFKK